MWIKPFNWISVMSEDVEILPEWVEPTNSQLTLVKVGYVDTASLLTIPGANDEHLLFKNSATGRMSEEHWQAFLATTQQMRLLISDYIGHFNHVRPHSKNDYLPPALFEQRQREMAMLLDKNQFPCTKKG